MYVAPCYKNQVTTVKRYCSNPVLDAVLASYLQKAEDKGIRISAKIALPDTLPAKDAELATVFANAIENAMNACDFVKNMGLFMNLRLRKTDFLFGLGLISKGMATPSPYKFNYTNFLCNFFKKGYPFLPFQFGCFPKYDAFSLPAR